MNQNRNSQLHGIFDLKPRTAGISILGTDKGMKDIAGLDHFFIALIISFGHFKPGPNV